MISQNSCILCQKVDENLTNVLLKKEDDTNLKQQLSLCVPEINWNCSDVSPYVCELCVDKLNVAVDIRQKCLEKYESHKELVTPNKEIVELKKKLMELQNEPLKMELKASNNNPCKLIKTFSKFNIGIARGCYSCIDCRNKKGCLSVNKILSGRIVRKRSRKSEIVLPMVQDRSVNVSEDDLLSSIPNDSNEKLDLEQKLIQYYRDTADDRSSIDSFNRSTVTSREGYNYRNPFIDDYSKSTTEQILQDLCTIAFPLTSMRHITNHKSKRAFSFGSSRKSSLETLCGKNYWKYSKYSRYDRSRTPSVYSSQRSQHFNVNEKILKCNICGKEYKLEKKYEKHMLDKHGIQKENLSINSYSCPDCDLNFYTQTQLDKHAKIHSLGTTYKCEYCDRCFVRQANLHKHMRIKHDNDLSTFGDKNCEKSSSSSSTPNKTNSQFI